MPSASRNANRKRRARRNLTLITWAARTEAINRVKVTSVLLTVLQKLGGEVEVSQTDLNTTIQSLGKIQYVVEKKNPTVEPFDGQFVIRLVATTEEQQNAVEAQDAQAGEAAEVAPTTDEAPTATEAPVEV